MSELEIQHAATLWCDLTSLAISLDERHFRTLPVSHARDPWLNAATSLKSLPLCFPDCYDERWHLQKANAERFIALLRDASLEALWLDAAWFAEEGLKASLTQHAAT